MFVPRAYFDRLLRFSLHRSASREAAKQKRIQTVLQEATEETEIDPEERRGGRSVNGLESAIICGICG
jgi:hypothetical protein